MDRTFPDEHFSATTSLHAALAELEHYNRIDIAPLLQIDQPLARHLRHWMDTSMLIDARYTPWPRTIAKQDVIQTLWQAVTHNSLIHEAVTLRRREIMLFCVVEAFRLNMQDAEAYYDDLQPELSWLMRACLQLAIPGLHRLSQYH